MQMWKWNSTRFFLLLKPSYFAHTRDLSFGKNPKKEKTPHPQLIQQPWKSSFLGGNGTQTGKRTLSFKTNVF
jgi:hypothetical protein